jgi:hypothetical protein
MTDADIRQLLILRAVQAAAELADPGTPEAQEFLRSILTTDPAEVRKALADRPE